MSFHDWEWVPKVKDAASRRRTIKDTLKILYSGVYNCVELRLGSGMANMSPQNESSTFNLFPRLRAAVPVASCACATSVPDCHPNTKSLPDKLCSEV